MGRVSDRYSTNVAVQSPLDFAVHDMNHGRRILGYCEGGLKERGVLGKGMQAEMEVFKEWDSFIKNELLPHTDIKHKKGNEHMMRLIAFEMLHESAVNPTRADLLKCLDRKEGAPEPSQAALSGLLSTTCRARLPRASQVF